MTFQRLNPSTIAIKAGQGMFTATTDGTLKVGDHLVEGPGEYDIAGIGLHVFADHAFVIAEAIHTCVVWKNEVKISEDEDAAVDILVCMVDSVEAINAMVKANDPRVIILADEVVAEAVARQDGIEVDRPSSYKITAAALPADTRAAVLLA